MAFHDVRFPDNISRGARGGPRRRVQIVTLHSGFEERNASWSASRREYDVAFGIRSTDQLQQVTAFWEAVGGQLMGFRFKDWGDYKSCSQSRVVSARDQALGVGDGVQTEFQLRKGYTSGAGTYWRPITRPVQARVHVALDGLETFSGWSVDPSTGVVTFDTAPEVDVEVSAGFEFDVPARFDTDYMPTNLDIERKGSIESIPIIEIRES
ncbi:TIGR02217 family protein [Sulfitobacter sp. 1A12126]|uniref:phage distal tail protein, Rcc01695 family n=1 Tax=Sulfitobacter sp. 1A12126 TaxID=3368591 RepID=UPI003745678E